MRIKHLPRGVLVLFICVVCASLFLLNLTYHLLREFVFYPNASYTQYDVCNKLVPRRIPKHVHQIYLGQGIRPIPERFLRAGNSWKEKNPGYGYTLWNRTMVDEIISKNYTFLKAMFDGYTRWIRRVDVARYVVMHQHGGWYADMDYKCIQSIDSLSNAAMKRNKTLVVYYTAQVGFANDLIGTAEKTDFFLHVLKGLAAANRWYIFPYATTIFSTGPMFFWGRFLNYPCKNIVYEMYNHSDYVINVGGATWYGWDGEILAFFFYHRERIWYLYIPVVLFLGWMIYRKIRNRTTSTKLMVLLENDVKNKST